MPRKKLIINPADIELLKKSISVHFGRQIRRSFECVSLASKIREATGEHISPNTIRRFFGFLDTSFSTAIQTLNTLSQYCGYGDWDDFLENAKSQSFVPLTYEKEMKLYLGFYSIALHDEQDINYHNASRLISNRILENCALLEGLMKPLAEKPMSQIFFYEKFPFIDGLAATYTRGVKLYLKNNPKTEARIFGHSLLLLGAFLSQNKRPLANSFEILKQYQINSSWHPFVIARFLGSQLLFHHASGNYAEKLTLLQLIKEYNEVFKQISNIRFWKFPYFQFMICDYLNLVREHQLAYELVQPLKSISKKNIEVEDGYFDVLCIIARTAAIFLSKSEREYSQWPLPNFEKIGIIFKKYYTIWHSLGEYHSLPDRKRRKREEVRQKIDLLIKQTGFSYLNQFLE